MELSTAITDEIKGIGHRHRKWPKEIAKASDPK